MSPVDELRLARYFRANGMDDAMAMLSELNQLRSEKKSLKLELENLRAASIVLIDALQCFKDEPIVKEAIRRASQIEKEGLADEKPKPPADSL